jgi:hypothetical protein
MLLAFRLARSNTARMAAAEDCHFVRAQIVDKGDLELMRIVALDRLEDMDIEAGCARPTITREALRGRILADMACRGSMI